MPAQATPPDGDEDEACVEAPAVVPASEKPIRIAVVGRPNAGKSTLVNRLLGEERLLSRDFQVVVDRIGQPKQIVRDVGPHPAA